MLYFHKELKEKFKSLFKFGIRSTRYKDIFDFYYLINNDMLNKNKLIKYIDLLIVNEDNISQNILVLLPSD